MFPKDDEKFDAQVACLGYAGALWAIVDPDPVGIFIGIGGFVGATILIMIIFIRRNWDDI